MSALPVLLIETLGTFGKTTINILRAPPGGAAAQLCVATPMSSTMQNT